MPFDSGGTFTRDYNWQQDRDNGIKILADRMDGEFDNYAGGLNLTFLRTGTVPMTGPINMNGNPIVDIAAGTPATPGLRFSLDGDTGIYQPAVGVIAVSSNGVKVVEFKDSGLAFFKDLTMNGKLNIGDTKYTLDLTGDIASIHFDTTDGFEFDRSDNLLNFVFAGVPKLALTATQLGLFETTYKFGLRLVSATTPVLDFETAVGFGANIQFQRTSDTIKAVVKDTLKFQITPTNVNVRDAFFNVNTEANAGVRIYGGNTTTHGFVGFYDAAGSQKGFIGGSLVADTLRYNSLTGHYFSGGNVGINVSVPKSAFHVGGNAAATMGLPVLGEATNSAMIVAGGAFNSAYGLNITEQSNGNISLQGQRFDTNLSVYAINLNPLGGNVGIGVANGLPAVKLHVKSVATGELLRLESPGNDVGLNYISYYGLNGRMGYIGFGGSGNANMTWSNDVGNVSSIYIGGAEIFRVADTGVSVIANVTLSAPAVAIAPSYSFGMAGGVNPQYVVDQGDYYAYTRASNIHAWYINSVSRFSIDLTQGIVSPQLFVGTSGAVDEGLRVHGLTNPFITLYSTGPSTRRGYIMSTAAATSLVADGPDIQLGHGAAIAFIGNTASWRPTNDAVKDLGIASNRWRTVYASTGTINTSDAREKQLRGELNSAELAVAKRIAKAVNIYRWLSDVDARGSDAPLQAGVTAQAIVAAFDAEGLNALSYGFVVHETWEAVAEIPGSPPVKEQDEIQDGDGNIVQYAKSASEGTAPTPGRDAGEIYGVRYADLAMFILAAQEQRLAALEA